MHNLKDMPRYKSHKIVQAAQVTEVRPRGEGEYASIETDYGRYSLATRADTTYEVGGYLVSYDNGRYFSYSPKTTFEAGYTLLNDYEPETITVSKSDLVAALNVTRLALHSHTTQDDREAAERLKIALIGLADYAKPPMKLLVSGDTLKAQIEADGDGEVEARSGEFAHWLENCASHWKKIAKDARDAATEKHNRIIELQGLLDKTTSTPPDAEVISSVMDKEQIDHMVQRFLGWRLPENFSPDNGISFKFVGNEGTPHAYKRFPTGTNLLHVTQAREMILHMIKDMPGCAEAEEQAPSCPPEYEGPFFAYDFMPQKIMFKSGLGDTNALDVLNVRGWGYLTGRGEHALKLPQDVAAKIQDNFGKWVIETLNAALQPVAT